MGGVFFESVGCRVMIIPYIPRASKEKCILRDVGSHIVLGLLLVCVPNLPNGVFTFELTKCDHSVGLPMLYEELQATDDELLPPQKSLYPVAKVSTT